MATKRMLTAISQQGMLMRRTVYVSIVLACLLLCNAGLAEEGLPQPTPLPPADDGRPIELVRADAVREALRTLDPADYAGSINSPDLTFDVYLVEGHAPLNLPYADTGAIRFHTVQYSLRQLYDLQLALRPLYGAGVRVTETNVPENRVDLDVLNPAADLEARIAALCPDKDMYTILTPGKDESGGAYLAQNETGSLLHDQRTVSLMRQATEVLDGLDASEYGGFYYSDNMWALNVNILKGNPGVASLLPDAPDVIRLHEVKYSEAELRQLQDAMGERMAAFGIYFLSVDTQNNHLEIGLLNETDEVLSRLHSEFPDTGMYAVKSQKRDWRENKEVTPYGPERLNNSAELLLDNPSYPEDEVKLGITLKNHTGRTLSHGDLFSVEIWHEEAWYVLPMINSFSDLIGYGLSAYGEEHFERDLERQYGDLAPGNYRLIMDFGEDGYARTEFDITPAADGAVAQ